jgi:hypothetical protein
LLSISLIVALLVMMLLLDGSLREQNNVSAVSVEVKGTEGVVGTATQMSNDINKQTTVASLMTEGIPIFPGAKQHSGKEKDGPYSGLYMFVTTAPMEDVIAFYKQELANKQWVLALEHGVGNRYNMIFDWKNPRNEIPLRRHLDIGFSTPSSHSQTDILLDFSRWPDPTQVPLYPDAQNVEVKWGKDPDGGYVQRVITYESGANTAAVVAYYKDMMGQHGWRITESTSNLLIFMYSHSLPPPSLGPADMLDRSWGTGSIVQVTTYEEDNDKTKVELHIQGDEIDLLYNQGQR